MAFRDRNATSVEWIDLFQRMHIARVTSIVGNLTKAIGAHTSACLLYRDLSSVTVLVSSNGGDVYACVALVDLIRGLKESTSTVLMG